MPSVEQALRSCTKCPELVHNRTNVVIGEGPIPCNMVCLGEAPGAREDALGIPFVGPSGRLLRQELSRIGVTTHILNMVKCRPPENRDPTPEEIENCSHFLKLQLRAVKPKVILALGRYSIAYVTGQVASTIRVTKYAGAVVDTAGIKAVCTFHPAFILRNHGTDIEELFRKHIKKAANLAMGQKETT